VLLLLSILGIAVVPLRVYAAKGDKQYNAGKKAEARRDYDTALREYEEAANLDPGNPQYTLAAGRARFEAGSAHITKGQKYQAQGNLKDAVTEFEQAVAIDPSSDSARQALGLARLMVQQEAKPGSVQSAVPDATPGMQPGEEDARISTAQGPAELKPLTQAPINLKITNESKVVLETIGKLAGVNVLFDPDFVSKRITVELNGVSLEDALDQTAVLTKTFWKPLTANTILVIPDTAVKRREQEEQVIKTFYLSNPVTPQELTEAVTAIRSLLETRRIQQINALNAIIIRDTPDRVAIAEKIIQDIDKAKPEVVVDVSVLEVRRDKSVQLGIYPVSGGAPGINIPATFTAGVTPTPTTTPTTTIDPTTGLPTTTPTTPTTPTTTPTGTIGLNQLGRLSTGDFSVTLPGATLTALLGDSNTRVLQRPEVRATDGQKATLRIGDRLPIATGSFQPGIGGVGVNPLVNTQFQYIDVGVNLDITPKVHQGGEITLKVRVEISQKTGTSTIGGIEQPIIGQRIIDHDIRLREGEINVLGGLMQTQTTKSLSGIPGLSQIPLLKYLFSNVRDTLSEDEVLIVMTPHTVRFPNFTPLNRRSLDIGTEGDVHLRSAAPAPAATPAPAGASPAGVPASPGTPAPSPAARIHFENPNLIGKSGETFKVPVQIENARDASSASFEVSYNMKSLKLVRVENGNFLGRDGQPIAVVEREDDDLGKAVITLNRPPESSGVSGSGTLAVLTFEAAQPGTSPMGINPAGANGVALAQATVTIQ
jgi:general secretion pathway protein D